MNACFQGQSTLKSRCLPTSTVNRHLGERECSVRRPHQKVFEEAPGPTMTEAFVKRWARPLLQQQKPSTTLGRTVEFLLAPTGVSFSR